MASQFKCKICDSVFTLQSEAVACCTSVEEESFYVCPHCNQHHEDEDDAKNCCSYVELHDIQDYRKLFAPLYQKTEAEFELLPEFMYQLSENTFKIVLPNPYIRPTLADALNLICSVRYFQVNPTYLEIKCDGESLFRMKQHCSHLLTLLLAKPHWSLNLSDIGGLQRLSGLLKNNGVNLDEYEILNHELTQKAVALHFDITHGEIFLTDTDNQVLLKINHVNQSIAGLDPQWFLIKSNQTEAV